MNASDFTSPLTSFAVVRIPAANGLEEMPRTFSKSWADRLERGDRPMIRILLEGVRSWDFGKVREHYEQA